MSAATEERIVKDTITLCDICGEKIVVLDAKDKNYDPDDIGTIAGKSDMRNIFPTANVQTKRMRFFWPTSRAVKLHNAREKEKSAGISYIRQEEYDFHGECLLNLVDAAIALRTAPKKVDEGFKIHD